MDDFKLLREDKAGCHSLDGERVRKDILYEVCWPNGDIVSCQIRIESLYMGQDKCGDDEFVYHAFTTINFRGAELQVDLECQWMRKAYFIKEQYNS